MWTPRIITLAVMVFLINSLLWSAVTAKSEIQNITVSYRDTTSITLTVTCQSRAFEKYLILYNSSGSDQTNITISGNRGNHPVTTNDVTLTNLEAGTAYYISVYYLYYGKPNEEAFHVIASTTPDPPKDVLVISENTKNITLNITEPVIGDVDAYYIHYGDTAATFTSHGLNTFSVITGLQPGTEYAISVSSVFNNITSQTHRETIGYTRPSQPDNVTVIQRTSSSITVGIATGVGRYDGFRFVYRKAQGIDSAEEIHNLMDTNTSSLRNDSNHTHAILQSGTLYNIDIYTSFNGLLSESFSIDAATLPNSPTNVTVKDQSKDSITLIVTHSSGGLDGYIVEWKSISNLSSNGMQNFTLINASSLNSELDINRHLQAGTMYTFSVYTVANGLWSSDPFGDIRVATVPLAPTHITVQSKTTSITLAVHHDIVSGGDLDGYNVSYRSLSENNLMNIFQNFTETTNTSYIDLTNLTAGRTYDISVYTLANNLSSQDAYRVNVSTVPTSPTNVTLKGQTEDSVTLIVTHDSVGVDGYFVQWRSTSEWKSDGTQNFTCNHSPKQKKELRIDNGLHAGILYTFSVFTVANDFRSNAAFCCVHAPTLPTAPTHVTVQSKTTTSITLAVQRDIGAGGDLDGYNVSYRSLSENSLMNVIFQNLTKTTNTSYLDLTNLIPRRTYEISVYTLANNLSSEDAYRVNVSTDMCEVYGHTNDLSTLEEGRSAEFQGHFSTSKICASVYPMPIHWYIGDMELKNSTKVKLFYNNTEKSQPWSKLILTEVSLLSPRQFSVCLLEDCHRIVITNIIEIPRMSINPLTISIEKGGDINITCQITNYGSVNTTGLQMKWTNANNMTTPNPEEIKPRVSVISFRSVTEMQSGNYTCIVDCRNPACPLTSTSSLKVYNRGVTTCPEDMYFNLKWEKTPVGSTQNQSCPTDFNGFASRYCKTNGKWDPPNLINCVRKAIDNALKQIEMIQNGIASSSEVSNILESMENATTIASDNDTNILSSGDLSKSTTVLNSLVDVIDVSNQTQNATHDFVSVLNNMLSPKNQDTWTEVNEYSPKNNASSLMKTVEKLGKAVGKVIKNGEKPIVVRKENIVVEINHSNKDTILAALDIISTATNIFHDSIALNLNRTKDQRDSVTFTSALYPTIAGILPKRNSNSTMHVSEVLAMSIVDGYKGNRKLTSNISLKFDTEKLMRKNNLNGKVNTECVFWNFNQSGDQGGWSNIGCTWLENKNICSCNHLTNFAVLMSPIEITDKLDIARLRIITLIGCSLSVLCSVVTMIVYIRLWRYVKSDSSRLLLNLCAALTVAYILFLGGINRTENEVVCTVIAALMHYFFLAMFCLMLSEGIQLLIGITIVFKVSSKLKWLLLIGWGIPAMIVGVTVGIKYDGEYHSKNYCWLTVTNGVIYSFVGPALGIIVVNIVVLILVLKALYSSRFILSKSEKEKALTGVRSVCVLLPILGITWIFGVLSVNDGLILFQYLFAVTNSLQGVFIFLFYCVLKTSIRHAMKSIVMEYESHKAKSKVVRTKSSSQSESTSDTDPAYEEYKTPSSSLSNIHLTARPSQLTSQFTPR